MRALLRTGLGLALGLMLGVLLVGVPGWAQVQLIPNIAGVLPNSLVWTSATVVTFQPALDVAQTWNNAANPFTLIRGNATDTASASGLLLDLQKNGVSVFSVSKAGGVTSSGPQVGVSETLSGSQTTGGVLCAGATLPFAFNGGDLCGPISIAASPGAPGTNLWILRVRPLGNGSCKVVIQAGMSLSESQLGNNVPC